MIGCNYTSVGQNMKLSLNVVIFAVLLIGCTSEMVQPQPARQMVQQPSPPPTVSPSSALTCEGIQKLMDLSDQSVKVNELLALVQRKDYDLASISLSVSCSDLARTTSTIPRSFTTNLTLGRINIRGPVVLEEHVCKVKPAMIIC
jgi:hypothetical protein